MKPVPLHPTALAAHGLSPRDVAAAFPGTVIVTADGALRVTDAGGLDPVNPFGRKSIASDPAAIRRLP